MWTKNISMLKNFSFRITEDFFKQHGVLSSQNSREYKFFCEKYIHDVWFDEESFVLKGKSYHSQKKNEKPHHMTMQLNKNPVEEIECHCSCEIGLSQSCHHLIGLAFFLNDLVLRGAEEIEEGVASTSKPMEWLKPRGTKVIPEAISSVAFYKPTKIRRKKGPIQFKIAKPSTSIMKTHQKKNVNSRMLLKKRIKKINKDIPLVKLIKKEDTMTVLQYQMEGTDCLPIELPLLNQVTTNILISLPQPNMEAPTFEESKELEKNTRNQHSSKLWHEKRKCIFTSSTFMHFTGILCKRSKPVDLEFFENLWKEKDLDYIKSIEHGRKEESNARVLYQNKTGNKVFSCGLVIHPYAPHLGTSSDGVVVSADGIGVLEIKCPFGKKSKCLKGALKSKNFFLKEDENKQIIVNTNHKYYHQIQGQMLITGVEWCDFCTYFKNSEELVVTRVNFDENFTIEMYNTLTLLYNVYLDF